MVIKAFKKVFIPHKHNDYKPHFFRELSIISLAIVIVALFAISSISTLYIKGSGMSATVLPAVLVDLTNSARLSNNTQILARNTVLDQAAQLKAEDMARNGYFAHTSPTGVTPWHWFGKAGYVFSYAGENLAINFTESVDVEKAWLNSPTHRANILNAQFTEIGIATMDGIYQGYPTTYVVQMFGKPAKAIAPATPKPVTATPTKDVKPVVKPSTQVAVVSPVVKGETSNSNQDLEVITETTEFVAVKNISAEEKVEGVSTDEGVKYSSWYDRLLFLAPSYTDRIYRTLIWVVLVALLLMSVIEVRLQDKKHIIYGLLVVVIMVCLIYINRSMFMTTLLA
jgi:hypothetical protein